MASPRYIKFKNIDPSLPSHCFIKLISNPKLARADTSRLFQLQSGHVPLNVYLHHFKRKERAQCPVCSTKKETPQHFPLECPAYAYERCKLKLKKGELETKFAEVTANEKKAVALVQYIQATGRFLEGKCKQPSNSVGCKKEPKKA